MPEYVADSRSLVCIRFLAEIVSAFPMPPATLPDHLLLFDGVCHLCHGAVQFVLRHDRQGRIHFAAIQSATGRQVYEQQGLDPEEPHTMLYISPQGVFRESEAALEIARTLGFPWNLGLVFKGVPRGLRDAVYRFIAGHRYRWFGKEDRCLMPQPGWQARFLD